MRWTVISDLHLEFYPGPKKVSDFLDLDKTQGTRLALAGDVCNLTKEHLWRPWIEEAAKHFDQIFWVAGNHEYYGSVFPAKPVKDLPDNTWFFEHQVGQAGFDVISTGWTCFDNDPFMGRNCGKAIADFSVISKRDSTKFTWYDASQEFVKFRKAVVERKPDNILTHFLPSKLSIHSRFKNERILNTYFNNGLLDTPIMDYPKLVIHGHTHEQCDYVHPCGTRVVANPVGYPGERNSAHDRAKIIDL